MLTVLAALSLALVPPAPPSVNDPTRAGTPRTEPAVLHTPSGDIFGTLVLPADTGRYPVAVIISGSGPTDRDGNTPLIPGANDGLRMLADSLASHGIASLRYDKRGIGASSAAADQGSQARAYTDPSVPLAPGLVAGVAGFLKDAARVH